MDDDTSPTGGADRLVGLRLRQLQRATDLPAVFEAPPRRADATGSSTSATSAARSAPRCSTSASAGRGPGGTTLLAGTLSTVPDCTSTRSITHEFDEIVVAQERISSICAMPVTVDGAVRAVVDGAVRGPHRIGDAVLEQASAFGTTPERELTALLRPPPAAPPALHHSRAAVQELTELARTTGDATSSTGSSSCSPAFATSSTRAGRRPRPGRRISHRVTPRSYLHSAMRRPDVHNRTAAVHAARMLGVL